MGRFIERLKSAKKERIKYKDCTTKKEKVKWIVSYSVSFLLTFVICALIFFSIWAVLTSVRSCSPQKASAEGSSEVLTYKTGTYNSGFFSQGSMYPNYRYFYIPLSNSENGRIKESYTYTYLNKSLYRDTFYTSGPVVYPSSGGVGAGYVGGTLPNYSAFSNTIVTPSGYNTGVVYYWYGLNYVAEYDNSIALYPWKFLYNIGSPSLLNVYYTSSYDGFNEFPGLDLTSGFPFIHLEYCWSFADIGIDNQVPIDYLTFNIFLYNPLYSSSSPAFDYSFLNYSVNLMNYTTDILIDNAYNIGYRDGVEAGTTVGNIELALEEYNRGVEDGYTVGFANGYQTAVDGESPFYIVANAVGDFLNIRLFGNVSFATILLICFGLLLLLVLFRVFFHG